MNPGLSVSSFHHSWLFFPHLITTDATQSLRFQNKCFIDLAVNPALTVTVLLILDTPTLPIFIPSSFSKQSLSVASGLFCEWLLTSFGLYPHSHLW